MYQVRKDSLGQEIHKREITFPENAIHGNLNFSFDAPVPEFQVFEDVFLKAKFIKIEHFFVIAWLSSAFLIDKTIQFHVLGLHPVHWLLSCSGHVMSYDLI